VENRSKSMAACAKSRKVARGIRGGGKATEKNCR
jgi:hypothetical protein